MRNARDREAQRTPQMLQAREMAGNPGLPPYPQGVECVAMSRPDLLAAVDLGSNSFHLQVGRVVDGQIYPPDTLREMVRLGAGLTTEKRIDRATQARALEALERIGERLLVLSRGVV